MNLGPIGLLHVEPEDCDVCRHEAGTLTDQEEPRVPPFMKCCTQHAAAYGQALTRINTPPSPKRERDFSLRIIGDWRLTS